MHTRPAEPVPPETARAARAAFPKGHRHLRLADAPEALCTGEAFLARFPTHGRPGLAPLAAGAGHDPAIRGGALRSPVAHAVQSRLDWT